LEFGPLSDPECTVVQIKTLNNKEEVEDRNTNDNYMKISGKEEEREAK
jgi:hypothetical protein